MSQGARGLARFLLGRVVGLVVTLMVTSFVVFGALYLTPGSQLGYLLGGRAASPAQIAEVKHQYHLDQPFGSRYVSYLDDLVHGRLGTSLVFKNNVTSLIAPRVGTTATLVVFASVLIVVVGIAAIVHLLA